MDEYLLSRHVRRSRWKISKPLTTLEHVHESFDGNSRVVRYLAVTTLIELFNGDLLSASQDTTIKRWKRRGETPATTTTTTTSTQETLGYDNVHTYVGHTSEVNKLVQITNDYFISFDMNGVAKSWSLITGECLHSFYKLRLLRDAACIIRSRVLIPDTPALLVGSSNGKLKALKVLSSSDIKETLSFAPLRCGITQIIELSSTAYSSSSSSWTPETRPFVAGSSLNGSVQIWNRGGGAIATLTLIGPQMYVPIESVAELSNGNIVGAFRHGLYIWNTLNSNNSDNKNNISNNTGVDFYDAIDDPTVFTPIHTIPEVNAKLLVSLPMHKMFVAVGWDGIIRVCNDEGRSEVVATASAMGCSCLIQLDNGTIASGFRNGRIKLWRVLPLSLVDRCAELLTKSYRLGELKNVLPSELYELCSEIVMHQSFNTTLN